MNARPPIVLPPAIQVLLSFLAGYVDSATFLGLFGLFVAQVTGSFVLVGVAPVAHEAGLLAKVLAIPTFLLAGILTTVLVSVARTARAALLSALALEAALLLGFAAAGMSGYPWRDLDSLGAVGASMCGLAAMGVQSAFVRLLSTSGSTNVMTTNTTQFAIDAAEMLLACIRTRRYGVSSSRVDLAAARARCGRVLPLIVGFAAGTVAGALAFGALGFACVTPTLLILAATAAWARRLA